MGRDRGMDTERGSLSDLDKGTDKGMDTGMGRGTGKDTVL